MLKSGEKKNNNNLFLCLFKKGNFFDEFFDHKTEIKYR